MLTITEKNSTKFELSPRAANAASAHLGEKHAGLAAASEKQFKPHPWAKHRLSSLGDNRSATPTLNGVR